VTPPARAITARRLRRRGAIFIAAMWVLIALVGLVMVMSRWARVEIKASGNRLAAAEAAMAARAGEQYVLSQIAATGTDATFSQQPVPEQVEVGGAYFWIVRSDRENDRQQDFGVDDEGAKVNINTASASVLQMLPGMTPDVADAIVDWRDANDEPSPYGAESEYYGSLQPPYRAKNGPFETVEELMLVKGVTAELLYGMDANRNGMLDDEEVAAGGTASSLNAANDISRGWLPFISVTGPGNAPAGGQQLTNVNGNPQPVVEVLRNALDKNRFNEVSPLVATGRPFRNIIDFYVKTRLKPEEFKLVADRLTVQGGAANNARVNANTAPREVLRCLPGLEDADAVSLAAARADADTTNLAWVAEAIDKNKAVGIGDQLTSRSYRFSADVIGVSGDGRAYQRVRIVVDASQATPRIVYRRDLTDTGWSLGWDVRESLRSGAGPGTGQMIVAQR
jgi:DNA uptake protein ComE-like DNA-binding protein